ncbi:MAG: aquaporin, partial [Candidatus Pacebacteria bacterium]|nr:aquaporin [Candidatus Paceibacterota bacterium]
MQNKLIAEGLGTFALALAVLTSLQMQPSPIATPVVAGLVLALFVYTIGSKSGSHINPAVTIGLWSINKIKTNDAVSYIIVQVLGGLIAYGLVSTMSGEGVMSLGMMPESTSIFLAEAIGSLFFGFGIAAVVYGKVRDDVNGLV